MVSEEISHSFRKPSPALTPACITTSEEVGRIIFMDKTFFSHSQETSISLRMRVCAFELSSQTLRMTRGYFNNQSANKTEKKAEDLKSEI